MVRVYYGEELARYGFGQGHPFGPDRLQAFWDEALRRGLDQVVEVAPPVSCSEDDLLRFHTTDYVARVKQQSVDGAGFLDYGDTSAFVGVFEAGCFVVGSVLDATTALMAAKVQRAFVPVAGLHRGIFVFNDIGVAINTLRALHGVRRIAYVDIDAHHGDGVFYAFEEDVAGVTTARIWLARGARWWKRWWAHETPLDFGAASGYFFARRRFDTGRARRPGRSPNCSINLKQIRNAP